MESTKTLVQFLQALKPELVDPEHYIDQITEHLDYLSREKCSSNMSYLVEIPQEQFQAWLKFKEQFFVLDIPSPKPKNKQSVVEIQALVL